MSYHLGSLGPNQREEFIGSSDEELRPRSRKLLVTAFALLVMALFAGGLWFAYTQGMRHTGASGEVRDVPLIRADERPTKVRPDKPGGMEIPDRDKLIYTQKRAAAVEHLLPPPEKPMPRPTPPAPPPVQPENSPPPPATAGGPAAPIVPAATPAIALAPPQQQAAAPPAKTPPSPSEKPAAASSLPAKPGGTRLQLGSVRSEDAARQEWDRIRRAAPDILGSLSATPVRADLGDRGVFYRILTGPVADADRICGELKRRDIGCIIAR